ncbi:protein TSSC4 [Anabas testudineus]|uniref:protein TSSC4 n=1 Tax=Anabas testudineus TaxID=64144 RepID=UPI000E45FBA7|nr:protein TSSC4 [Anabas testudineus]
MCDPSDDVDELSASDDSEPEEEPNRAPFDPELDSDDDDDNNVEEAVVSTVAAQTPFSLRGGSLAFSDRSHSIFDCLDTQLSSSSLKQDHITNKVFVQPHSSHPSRKTSLPPSTSPTPPKKRGVPDYLVHPERWTCYSLEDVPETSDQDNRRAAHQFLSGLQHEKESDSPCNIQQRMVFSRPKRPLKEKTTDQVSAVKGQEKGMHLSHLEQEEEEGSEREKAGGGRTDEREDGMVERNEKEDTRRKTERPEEEKQKQVQKEKEEEEKIEEVSCGFASFRKTKSKNYRKNAEQEDN